MWVAICSASTPMVNHHDGMMTWLMFPRCLRRGRVCTLGRSRDLNPWPRGSRMGFLKPRTPSNHNFLQYISWFLAQDVYQNIWEPSNIKSNQPLLHLPSISPRWGSKICVIVALLTIQNIKLPRLENLIEGQLWTTSIRALYFIQNHVKEGLLHITSLRTRSRNILHFIFIISMFKSIYIVSSIWLPLSCLYIPDLTTC